MVVSRKASTRRFPGTQFVNCKRPLKLFVYSFVYDRGGGKTTSIQNSGRREEHVHRWIWAFAQDFLNKLLFERNEDLECNDSIQSD